MLTIENVKRAIYSVNSVLLFLVLILFGLQCQTSNSASVVIIPKKTMVI